ERRLRISSRRERDDVVAALRAGDRMIARELAQPRPCPAAFERADVAEHGPARVRAAAPRLQLLVHPGTDEAFHADIADLHRRTCLTREDEELAGDVLT